MVIEGPLDCTIALLNKSTSVLIMFRFWTAANESKNSYSRPFLAFVNDCVAQEDAVGAFHRRVSMSRSAVGAWLANTGTPAQDAAAS